MRPQLVKQPNVAPAARGWQHALFRLVLLVTLVIAFSDSFYVDTHGSMSSPAANGQTIASVQVGDHPCDGDDAYLDQNGCCVMSVNCGTGVTVSAYALPAPEPAPERLFSLSETYHGSSPELQFRPPRLSAHA